MNTYAETSTPTQSTLNVADVWFKFSIKLSFTINDKILEERSILGLRLLKRIDIERMEGVNLIKILGKMTMSGVRTYRRRKSSKYI